jgi:predicted DNA-binding protein (MmcQ/YjbR family)
MDAERLRAFLLKLPHVVETRQWGDNLVYWVGDKAIGGKMFALINLDPGAGLTHGVLSYSAGPERFSELVELDGLDPAPYMARIHWVAARHWAVFRPAEWESELRAAHQLTLARLPPRTLATLILPAAQRKRLIAERRELLATREATRQAAKKPARKSAKKSAKKSVKPS